MDWADDVAYSVHDLEDGFNAGLITFENLKSPAERSLVSRTTATTYCDDGQLGNHRSWSLRGQAAAAAGRPVRAAAVLVGARGDARGPRDARGAGPCSR